jgi:hypothetical protein
VETILTHPPGIAKVQFNHLTGSILLFHTPDANLSQMRENAENKGLFLFDNPGEKINSISQRTSTGVRNVNNDLSDFSGGYVDMKSLLVLSLAVLGILQLLRGQYLPPGITLLWYAPQTMGIQKDNNQ